MSKYKAVVLDGRGILKKIVLIGVTAVVAVMFLSAVLPSVKDNISGKVQGLGAKILGDSIAGMDITSGNLYLTGSAKSTLGDICSAIIGFSPFKLTDVITAEMPLTSPVMNSGIPLIIARNTAQTADSEQLSQTEAETPAPVPTSEPVPENHGNIKEVDIAASAEKITINNQTDYGIDIEQMLKDPLHFDMSVSGPKVLILHTHATEAFSPDGATHYDLDESDRTRDNSQNVVRIGEEVDKILNSRGIETLHDTTQHDYPSFNGSYSASLKTADWYIDKFPSIQIVLDIHRDSIVYDDNTKARPVSVIDGKKAAQLMLVVGTDAGGLDHPNWRSNLSFALHLQAQINKNYPSLMRSVNLRKERFNGHTTKGSIIIEVGTSGNSLEEALYGASLCANSLADMLEA